MPRPKKIVKQSKVIAVRVTPLQKRVIENIAKETGLNTSEYLRTVGMNKKIYTRFTDEELEVYETLNQYKNYFTHIGNMFRNKNPQLESEVKKVTKLIYTHIKKFK